MSLAQELKLNIGDTISAQIFNTPPFNGKVTGFGTHKGRNVISLIDENGNGRFIYESQFIEIWERKVN